MERRRFTREFKLEAVRLIRDRGVPPLLGAGRPWDRLGLENSAVIRHD
jgi:hypothetical protein